MPRNEEQSSQESHLIDDLTLRIKNARRNHNEESVEVQIPLIARRLEKALAKQLAENGETQEFEIPMNLGCRVVRAIFYKEVNFGFAGRRRFVAIYRNNQWEIEYWYTSQSESNGYAQGATAEQALKGLLPSLSKTNAWELHRREPIEGNSNTQSWKPGTRIFRY